MTVRIKRVKLWRTEINNKPKLLASTLEPFAQNGVDLKVTMEYSLPHTPHRAVVEILTDESRRAVMAAKAAGFRLSPTPMLLIEGDNRPGLAYLVANTIAGSGISIRFLSAQVVGERYSALLGFQTNDEAKRAGALMRRIASPKKTN